MKFNRSKKAGMQDVEVNEVSISFARCDRCSVMDEFCVGTIVWASARKDIFWPGKVWWRLFFFANSLAGDGYGALLVLW